MQPALPSPSGTATAGSPRHVIGPSRRCSSSARARPGLTAAIYAARANLEPIVIAGSTPGGQLMLTSEVENYPGFPEGIDGPELMRRFREQAERFGTQLVDVDIERVDLRPARSASGRAATEYRAQSRDHRDRRVGDLAGARKRDSACGAAACQRLRDVRRLLLQGPRDRRGRRRRLRDGGVALPHEVRPQGPPAPPSREFRGQQDHPATARWSNPKIEVHTNTEVDEVLGTSKVDGLRIAGYGDRREAASCRWRGLFIAIGHKPNTDVFRDWLEVDQKGYLAVHDHTRSRIDGVFIAGDVHDHRYRQAITAAGDGCMAAIDAERWLEAEGITEAATATAW